MQTFLPGLKTNINTVLLAVTSIAGVAGIVIDPVTVTALVDQWWGLAVTGYGALTATGIWFRSLANK
jgi:hypothetical protein